MESVSPASLIASRVYFTEFDQAPCIYSSQTLQQDANAVQAIERKLKLLTLIKGHVVVAASHLLESEHALAVLLPHPRLFSEGIIVPALRTDYSSVEAFLDAKLDDPHEAEKYSSPTRRTMAQLVDASARLAVRWEVTKTSNWFKQRILSELDDEGSLLRACFRHQGLLVPSNLVAQLRDESTLSRNAVYRLAQATGDPNLVNVVCTYADFIYYLSGALAVDSEGVLPQENLLDFRPTDLVDGHTHLSETEIFFKLFIDIVKSVTHTHIPVDVLDALSIEDVIDLHQIAVADEFTEKYHMIQEQTKAGMDIHDPERLVLLMEELDTFEEELHQEYLAALEREWPAYRRAMRSKDAKTFVDALASLVVPWYSAPADTKAMLISGLHLIGQQQAAHLIESRVHESLAACDRLIDRRDSALRPVLLSFVQQLKARYVERL